MALQTDDRSIRVPQFKEFLEKLKAAVPASPTYVLLDKLERAPQQGSEGTSKVSRLRANLQRSVLQSRQRDRATLVLQQASFSTQDHR